MSKEKEYRVVWSIDVRAKSAKEAAEKALRIQRDPSSIATIFEVRCGDEEPEEIDAELRR